MSSSRRSIALCLFVLSGCAGVVGEPDRDAVFDPYTGQDGDAGAGASGTGGDNSSGTANGGDTGSTANGTSTNGGNATNGGTSNGNTGNGATTGGDTTGGATGDTTNGGSTGATSGGATGDATAGTTGDTGGTSGGTTGDATAGTTGGTGGGSTGDVPVDLCGDGTEPLATGLRLRQIALYQAVKIPLMTSGAWSNDRSAPVVQGKDALVRGFVDTLAGFSSRNIRGVLTLDNDGVLTNLTKDLKPSAASTDASLASTFNFDVAGADLGPNTKISMALLDPACPSSVGNASDARFPASGSQALGAQRIGKLRVVVVPMVVGGRSPDTSATQIANMKDAMLAHYPVPDVEITVRAAVTANAGVSAGGGGWSDVLNQVIRTRQNDRPANDVYYYGVMSPASSFNSYCGGGCVLGLAPQTTRVSPDQQAGLGIGFLNENTPDTMVHELGHAHGRGHAPCAQGGGIQGVDGAFPYNGGGIGVWGWDSRTGALQNPSSVKDVMGYCSPTWVSDYTYDALATRCLAVNQSSKLRVTDGTVWQGMLLYADGSSRWAGMSTESKPGGDVETAQVLDSHGAVVAEVEVIRVKLSHVDDQLLYVPEIEVGWSSLVLSDGQIVLGDVADPLP